MAFVSIIMPAFNAEKTIELAVFSVISQTFFDWELIIVNDCSTDSTVDFCARFEALDARIRVLTCSTNGGVARSRNLGLEAATGSYIAFLDSDDLWLPDKLALQIESISNSGHFSYMTYEHMNLAGIFEKIIIPPDVIDHQQALGGCQIGTLTVLLGKDLLANNKFPLRRHEDYALWLKLLREIPAAVRVGGIKPHARYRRSSTSLSGSKLKAITWQWAIYREQEKLSLLEATSYILRYATRGVVKHYL